MNCVNLTCKEPAGEDTDLHSCSAAAAFEVLSSPIGLKKTLIPAEAQRKESAKYPTNIALIWKTLAPRLSGRELNHRDGGISNGT